jgi:hypothetical protein
VAETLAATRRAINGEILDVASAAELLGCTAKSLRARVSRRTVPFRRLGSRVVFRRSELLEFFDTLDGCSPAEARENLARRGKSEAVTR